MSENGRPQKHEAVPAEGTINTNHAMHSAKCATCGKALVAWPGEPWYHPSF